MLYSSRRTIDRIWEAVREGPFLVGEGVGSTLEACDPRNRAINPEHAGSVRSQEQGHRSGARWKRAIPGTGPSVRSTLEACDPRNKAIGPEHAGSVRSQEQGHRSGARWKRAIPGTRPSVRSTPEAWDPRNGRRGGAARNPFRMKCQRIVTRKFLLTSSFTYRFCLPSLTYLMMEPIEGRT